MSRPSMLSNSFHSYPQPFGDPALASPPGLPYRPLPLHLPLRAPELPTTSYNLSHLARRPLTTRMANTNYTTSEQELADLQKLSNEYQPEVSGPLVSERQASSAITTEYANADPVYRIKTAALPQKYSHYRTCRGDGHCGWRAVAFTYFEGLLHQGDRDRFLVEEARLKSFRNMLNQVGYQEHLYEDFADEMYELLRKTAMTLPVVDGSADASLLASFNDPNVSMSIITYLKLLTSAWIQTHPDDFAPFLLAQDMSVKEYCSRSVEPAVCEIDNIGLSALVEVLVKPAGFALEVLYLDRSPGEEINSYRWDAAVSNGLPATSRTLRLLYRPGHYDILYKPGDIAQPIAAPGIPTPGLNAPVYVALADHQDDFVPMERSVPDVMALIPGMYPGGMGQPTWSGSSSYDFAPTPVQQQPQVSAVPSYPSMPIHTSSADYLGAPVHVEPPMGMPMNPTMPIERSGPFRPSIYELDPGFQSGQSHALPFQTSIFRNSHFNTAHFMNPDFQPEEWIPDSEYGSGSRQRHKSSSQ